MDNQELTRGYAEWALIIGLTLLLFYLFSKNNRGLGRLIAVVLLPVWVIIAVVKGIEYSYFNNLYMLFSPDGFMNLLAETLPMVLLIGGITFFVKYRKLKKPLLNEDSNKLG